MYFLIKCDISGDECRKRWTQIRDNYRKALKARATKSGQGASMTKPIRFEKELEFMRDFLGERRQLSNIQCPVNVDGEETNITSVDDEESTETSPSPIPSTSSSRSCTLKRSCENTNHSALIEYLNFKKANTTTNKMDHLTKYFSSLEETVRTFTPRLQIEAKMKISNIIHDLELKNLAHTNEPLEITEPTETSTLENSYSYQSQQEKNSTDVYVLHY